MTRWLIGGELGADGELVWTAPDWAIVVAVCVALAVWGLAAAGRRPPWSRAAELAGWAVALAAIVFALGAPVWVEEEGRTDPGRVAVLVDASRSMGILEDDRARSLGVEGVLDHVRRQAPEVELFHFGDDLVVGAPEAYDLAGTDVGGALEALSERVAGERLAGVVLVTDGLDRGLLRRGFHEDPTVPPAPSLFPGPLTVFQVGEATDIVDLAVRDIDAGGYAFIRTPFTIRATIQGIGLPNRSVPVTLLRDGATVTEQRVRLDESGRAEAEFEVVAPRAGRFAYSVRVPVYEGDAVPANNTIPVVVNVVRDRIRVLQVAGAPSWDVKFLRRFLKGDPSVQLVSFFILRTQRDLVTQYSDRELSLIQFPYERLFEEDLDTFDVVLFQNFDYRPYFGGRASRLLANLRDYVTAGGALVMIGGDRSFAQGHYGDTALAEVLPVEVGIGASPSVEPFRPRLTVEGARHPITRLVAEATENGRWWERLHEMDGTNRVSRAREGAAVLLRHPTLTDLDGQPLPVLAVQEVGEGRSMALTIDSSWRWSLSEAADGRGNQAYLRFWKNALRWLMQDATTSRITVQTPRENYAVGEEVRVVVRARTTGFGALANAEVAVRVDNEGQESTLSGRTDADGEVVLRVVPERSGTHRVRAAVFDDGESVGEEETVFAVTTRDPEVDEVAPDSAFLSWLADASGGVFHAPGERGEVLQDSEASRQVREVRETQLWRAPLLAFLIAGFGSLAWWLRRRSGLR